MYKAAFAFAAGTLIGLTLAPNLNRHDATEQQGRQTLADFPDLGKGLMETPGCVGVQTLSSSNSKQQAIGAWFENRKAMEAWYYGKMHQGAMAKFFPELKHDGKPFAEFKDQKAPIFVIASVTPSDKPIGSGSNLEISQIAIGGYTPIPGGIAIGGTYSPEKLDVPHLRRIPVDN